MSHHGVRAGVSSFGRDFEQQPRRRKIDAARPRRNHPQQPPQHRQRQQSEQHQRFGKTERQAADHAGALASAVRVGVRIAVRRGRRIRACSASKQFARRPVGAVDGEAPAEPVGLGANFIAMAFDARRVIGFARSRRGPR